MLIFLKVFFYYIYISHTLAGSQEMLTSLKEDLSFWYTANGVFTQKTLFPSLSNGTSLYVLELCDFLKTDLFITYQ